MFRCGWLLRKSSSAPTGHTVLTLDPREEKIAGGRSLGRKRQSGPCMQRRVMHSAWGFPILHHRLFSALIIHIIPTVLLYLRSYALIEKSKAGQIMDSLEPSTIQPEEEENSLQPNQVCEATMDFEAQEAEDLAFKTGEFITIMEPSELMFWYIGKNDRGETGMVPGNFLEPLSTEDDVPDSPTHLLLPTLSPLPVQPPQSTLPLHAAKNEEYLSWADGGGGYLPMNTASASSNPLVPPLPAKVAPQQLPKLDPVDVQAQIILHKELRRRLPGGTLVMGISQFSAPQPGDLPFTVYEEMMLLHPMEDPCWYYAQKTDRPEKKGAIPITHVRLVYMSDDEEEDIYKTPTKPGHDRLYDDINEFISQSGWFSYPGLAHGKQALLHVLAKKMRLSYEVFMAVGKAVYRFMYLQGEKVYIGKAEVLHTEIVKHFECFDKKRDEIREIDDELCHHTESAGWEISVWPLQPDQDPEAEWAKKIVENNSLSSREESGKLNETLTITNINGMDKFWDWFSPN